MKAHYRSVRNWPSMAPAVRSILQSGCGQGAEYKPLTRKVSRQGQKQEVVTGGREKIQLVSPTAGAEWTRIATPHYWLEGQSKSDWLNKRICSGGDYLLFFQISLGCLRWPAPYLLTPSPQTLLLGTPLQAETPPSVPPAHGSLSSSTAQGRSSASHWEQSGCTLVTVTSTPSTTWSG